VSDAEPGERAPDIDARVADALARSRPSADGGAYTAVFEEQAREAAGIGRRPTGPLQDATFAVKDMIAVRGQRRGGGSRSREGSPVCSDHAPVVATMLDAGAVLIGLTALHELAFGVTGINAYAGTPANPAGDGRIPGGSSSGSAVAVATGSADVALGTDTGGSIRQPASFCGVAGLMPSYGRVSRYGLVAFASSLDKIGPLGATVEDAAAVLSVIAGHDANDSTSAPVPVADYEAEALKPVRGLRIGVPEEYFGEGLDPEVRESVESGIAQLERLGCQRVSLRMPHTDYAIATYYILATAEASSNLARFDGVRYGLRVPGATLTEMYRQTRARGFGPEVKCRIMLGTYALSAGYYDAYYLRAQSVRTLIARDFADAFQKVDAIVTPTAPTPAFRLGEKTSDPLTMYLADIYTVTGSLAGVPGISVPCGKTKAGLPVGMQVFGPHFREGLVLQIAHAFEQTRASAS
jgi:aspartyl-tRNA(Asn)/glutamyl-tRNA(Gln) amidotransferase subunit A